MAINIIQQAISFLKESDIKGAIVSIFDSTGIAGFRFNVPKMEQVRLSNDITDYYSDSNTVFNDHVAHKPINVTVSGLQGDYFYSVHQLRDMISNVGTILKLVKAYQPNWGAQSVQNQLRAKWENYLKQLNTGAGIGANQNIDFSKTLAQNTTLKNKAKLLYNQFQTYDGIDLFNGAYHVSNKFYIDGKTVKFGPFEKQYKQYLSIIIQIQISTNKSIFVF